MKIPFKTSKPMSIIHEESLWVQSFGVRQEERDDYIPMIGPNIKESPKKSKSLTIAQQANSRRANLSDGGFSPGGCPTSKLPKMNSLIGRRLPDGSSNHNRPAVYKAIRQVNPFLRRQEVQLIFAMELPKTSLAKILAPCESPAILMTKHLPSLPKLESVVNRLSSSKCTCGQRDYMRTASQLIATRSKLDQPEFLALR